MYFVQKEGVYPKGIYFYSSKSDPAIRVAKTLAHRDIDDYHDWVVYQYVASSDSQNPNNNEVFRTYKQVGPEDSASWRRMSLNHGTKSS